MKAFKFKRKYYSTCTIIEDVIVKADSKEDAISKINNAVEVPYLNTNSDIYISKYTVKDFNTANDDVNICVHVVVD